MRYSRREFQNSRKGNDIWIKNVYWLRIFVLEVTEVHRTKLAEPSECGFSVWYDHSRPIVTMGKNCIPFILGLLIFKNNVVTKNKDVLTPPKVSVKFGSRLLTGCEV